MSLRYSQLARFFGGVILGIACALDFLKYDLPLGAPAVGLRVFIAFGKIGFDVVDEFPYAYAASLANYILGELSTVPFYRV